MSGVREAAINGTAALAAPGSDHGFVNPLDRTRRVRAVLFDLDGTLYRQRPLRLAMALELATLPLTAPSVAARRLRALRAYRRAQEQLRELDHHGSIAAEQITAAAAEAGLPVAEVRATVAEWMEQRPLKYVRRFKAAGLDRLLTLLDQAGAKAGILSDYPAESKLKALGLSQRFSPVLCSSDPEIGALKPSPQGFLRASRLWRLLPRDVLVVGDRVDVDAAGAAAAGMPCVIVGRARRSHRRGMNYLAVPSIERLCDVLDTCR